MFAVQPEPATVEAEIPHSHGRFLAPLMLLLAAVLCGAAGWWGTPEATKPIAEVQFGERVHAVNPLGAESGEAEPAPATHRRVEFRMEKSGGELIDFELLWPLERIRTTGAVPGSRIRLSMAELGGSGVAEVLAIGPCPPIARGTGSVVTGRFVHRVHRILEVETDDGATIGATPNHPFWSEESHAYRPIGEFRVGDHVRIRTGQLARLTSITPRDGPTTVYNVAVHGQHVYHVGPAGVLVHNCNGFAKNSTDIDGLDNRFANLDDGTSDDIASGVADDFAELGDDPVKYAEYVQGPGELVNTNEHMSDLSREYQSQVGGLESGLAYEVNGVRFDGYADGALIEAKGRYAHLMNNPSVAEELADRLEAQALRQLDAADGVPIKWIVAEDEFATGLRAMFAERGIEGIEVVFQAVK